MSTNRQIRVLVADDHPVVCFGLAAMINSQPDMEVVAQAANGQDALRLFRDHLPDVCLVDLRMPKVGGVEVIRSIRQQFPNSAFIVLTTYQGDEDIHRALTAGALGYLLKGMPQTELLDAIRSVYTGNRYVPEPVRETLAGRPADSQLSGREVQILQLIVKGFPNKRIAEELGIAEATVKWHVNIILSRMNVSDRTQAAIAAIHRGIVEA